MANQEHVDRLLGQNVAAWNCWREQHVNEQPDLSIADLSGTILTGADLTGAKLNGAKLRRAKLNRARLGGADLIGTDLRGANLESIQGKGATFQEADLRDIPWLLIMQLTLQPGIDCTGIRWDRPTDA